jgi:hypothetical protein
MLHCFRTRNFTYLNVLSLNDFNESGRKERQHRDRLALSAFSRSVAGMKMLRAEGSGVAVTLKRVARQAI